MLAAQAVGPRAGVSVQSTFLLHARTLLSQIDPRIDTITYARLLLSAVGPANLRQLLADGSTPERIADAVAALTHADFL